MCSWLRSMWRLICFAFFGAFGWGMTWEMYGTRILAYYNQGLHAVQASPLCRLSAVLPLLAVPLDQADALILQRQQGSQAEDALPSVLRAGRVGSTQRTQYCSVRLSKHEGAAVLLDRGMPSKLHRQQGGGPIAIKLRVGHKWGVEHS